MLTLQHRAGLFTDTERLREDTARLEAEMPDRGYLRPDFVRECPHDGLMRLLTVITNASDRDHADDETLDVIALELARRQSPLCRVCEHGEPGVCDERCDWIPAAKMEGWRS